MQARESMDLGSDRSASSSRIFGKEIVEATLNKKFRNKEPGGILAGPGEPIPRLSTSMNKNAPTFSVAEAFQINKLQTEGKLFVLSAVIGATTGASITLFKTGIHVVMHIAYGDSIIGNLSPLFHQYSILFIPLAGGIAVGILKQIVGSFGGGLNEIIGEVSKGVPINALKPMTKTGAAILTLGTGCSLGPEGPMVEVGASISRWLSQMFNAPTERRRIYLAAGAAAGVAAGFNAPIAALFFAQEVILNSSAFFDSQKQTPSSQVITSLLLASSISSLIAQIGLGSNPAFKLPLYDIQNPVVELPVFVGLGVVVGGASIAFKAMMRWGKSLFESPLLASVPKNMRPAIGGLACGLVAAMGFPQILFFGYETLDALLADANFPLWLLLSLVVLKPLMTCISLGSGLVGGTLAPTMFLGATLGASYGKILHFGYTGLSNLAVIVLGSETASAWTASFSIADPPAYSIIGMAAALAGVFRAPLFSILLIFEMTRDYRILLPLMASVGLSSWYVERYETDQEKKQQMRKDEQLNSSATIPEPPPRPVSQNQLLDFGDRTENDAAAILESMNVGECMNQKLIVLYATDTVQAALDRMDIARDGFAVVVCRGDQNLTSLYGVITVEDMSKLYSVAAADSASNNNEPKTPEDVNDIPVGDICAKDIVSVFSYTNLRVAYELLQAYALHQLIVFKDDQSYEVLGIIDADAIRTSYKLEEIKRRRTRIILDDEEEKKRSSVVEAARKR